MTDLGSYSPDLHPLQLNINKSEIKIKAKGTEFHDCTLGICSSFLDLPFILARPRKENVKKLMIRIA